MRPPPPWRGRVGEAACRLGVPTTTGRDSIDEPGLLQDGDAFGVGRAGPTGGQAETPPRGAQNDQRRDRYGQEGELQGFEDLDPSGLRGQGRHQGDHEKNTGEHRRCQADRTRSPPRRHLVRGAGPVGGSQVGPLVGGPVGHRFGRRWKNPHRHTTKSVPMGMAKVRACAPTRLLVPSMLTTFRPGVSTHHRSASCHHRTPGHGP